jgi:hypothetical protein
VTVVRVAAHVLGGDVATVDVAGCDPDPVRGPKMQYVSCPRPCSSRSGFNGSQGRPSPGSTTYVPGSRSPGSRPWPYRRPEWSGSATRAIRAVITASHSAQAKTTKQPPSSAPDQPGVRGDDPPRLGQALTGKTLAPDFDAEVIGRMGFYADPQGVASAILQCSACWNRG